MHTIRGNYIEHEKMDTNNEIPSIKYPPYRTAAIRPQRYYEMPGHFPKRVHPDNNEGKKRIDAALGLLKLKRMYDHL